MCEPDGEWMGVSEKIRSSYGASKNIYDDVITHRKWWSKLYAKLVWNGVDDPQIAAHLLSLIPDDWEGKLLDVPVGTGIFTHEKYAKMTQADITCVDYSEDMLEIARGRLHAANIKLEQGDVGHLPYEDESFDIVFSMNGFHVFPDKEKAFEETNRVLKKGGLFLACFYVKEKLRMADFVAQFILSRKGWFTPPFETEQTLRKRLQTNYHIEQLDCDGAIVYFCARKR